VISDAALSASLACSVTSIPLCFALGFQGSCPGGELSSCITLLSLTGGAFGGFLGMLSGLARSFRRTGSLTFGNPHVAGVARRTLGCLPRSNCRIIRAGSGLKPLQRGGPRGGSCIEPVSEISARVRTRRRG
jgi:hypothetical protein